MTLVEGGPRLRASTSEKPGRWAVAFLKARGVSVKLGARVVETEAGVAVTSDGARLPYDLLLSCVGAAPATTWLKDGLLAHALDGESRIRIEPTLQVTGFSNVFAAGDVTDCAETELGIWAGSHAEIVSANLKRLITGGPATKLTTYKPATGIC